MILTLFCGIAMYFVKFHIIPIVQHYKIDQLGMNMEVLLWDL